MGILNNIFGSSKNAETIVTGAVKGLDAIFFTKEEKSQANQKLADWYLKYLSAHEPPQKENAACQQSEFGGR